MAKNMDFSKSRNMRELDDSLKSSFRNIKNDMTTLKESVHQQGVKIAEIGRESKDSRADFVTIDKFNILKIKIGELGENMKKVWDIEKKLEDVDRKSVAADQFDKQNITFSNEIAKLRQDLEELDRTAATEEQTKDLAADINDEFDKIKAAIEELRSIKDAITRKELEKRTDKLHKRDDAIEASVDKLDKELKTKIAVGQVEALVSDINKEFDSLKEAVAVIREEEDRFALGSKVEHDMERLEKKISKANENLSDIMSDFTKGIETSFRDLVNASERRLEDIEKTVGLVDKDLSSAIDKTRSGAAKDLDKQVKRLQADLDKVDSKLQSKLEKDAGALQGQIEDINSDLRSRLDELKTRAVKDRKDTDTELKAFRKQVDDELKTLVKKQQVQNLVDDLNKEFDALKDDSTQNSKDITLIKKDFATREMVEAELRKLSAKVDNTGKDIAQLSKDAASSEEVGGLFDELRARLTETNRAMKERFKELFGMMKDSEKDSDLRFKEGSKDLDAVNKGMVKRMSVFVAKKELHSELDVVREEFDNLHSELDRIHDSVATVSEVDEVQKRIDNVAKAAKKSFINHAQFEKLQKQIEKMGRQLDDQSEYLAMRDSQLKELSKELKSSRRAQKKAERELARNVKYESVVESKSAKSSKKAAKTAAPEKKGRIGGFVSGFLIVAAFAILIAAIIFYYSGLPNVTDVLAIAAVVSFILGIIIRIVVAFRE